MKKLLSLLILCSLIQGCKKQQAAAPAQPAPVQNNQVLPPPQPTLTAREQQMVGYWIMDSLNLVLISNNTTQLHYTYTNSLTCKMEFRSNGYGGGLFQLEDGHNQCMVSTKNWAVPDSGYFKIGAQSFPITLITPTRLNFIEGGGLSEWRYYLHK